MRKLADLPRFYDQGGPSRLFLAPQCGSLAWIQIEDMTVIRRFFLIIMLSSLPGSAFAEILASHLPAINQPINFRNVPVSQVLQIYHDVTRIQLVIATDVLQEKRTITLVAIAHSPAEIATLIESALLKQTGITITKIDGQHASVQYNPKSAETNK